MTRDEIDALCAALRERYTELRDPLTWHSVQRVLKQAHIRYKRVPLDGPAVLLTHAGVSVILLNSDLPPRSHTEAMAHEFAHIQLHAGEPSEIIYHLWRPNVDDPRELEADYLTRCLLAGPDAAVMWPEPLSPLRVVKPLPPRKPVYPSFPFTYFDPYSPDAAPILAAQRALEPIYARAVVRRGRKAKQTILPTGKLRPQLDGFMYYTDLDGVTWQLRDMHVTLDGGRIRQREVPLESAQARVRYFVRTDGVKRMYRFAKWELREAAIRHLDRQVRESVLVSSKAGRLNQHAG